MGTEKHYIPGSFYRICDRTGFATRAGRTKREWNGLIVRNDVWEIRQPQDFVSGVIDDQSVPMARPRSIDSYEGPLHTFITTAANIGDLDIEVNSTARMYAGDDIQLVLDNSALLQTFIVKVTDATHLKLNDKLTWSAAVNNDLTNLSAVSPPNFGQNAFGQTE
jgi:hypothetical protein